MDTLTVDVRGLPDEIIQELEKKIDCWKQQARLPGNLQPPEKRRVDPSEFVPRNSKLKAPYSRALAYEG